MSRESNLTLVYAENVRMLSPRKKRRRGRNRRLRVQPLERRLLLHAEAAISGSVFFDADRDGGRNAVEAGVPGIVLELTSSDSSINCSVNSFRRRISCAAR